MKNNFAELVLDFHFSLDPQIVLQNGAEWIYPFENHETRNAMTAFFRTYYNDKEERNFIFGINPGRFGAGITGIAFTDPVRLQIECGIQNGFKKRAELSSIFVYECIEQMGGVHAFYNDFYITSLCPLGFIKNGKNYNYYDDRITESLVTPFIIQNIETQITFGCNRKQAFSMGQGKNFKFFQKLNDEYQWFEKIIPLPHPRWVMQYRLKRKQEFIDEYVQKLTSSL